ncbi:hypothetical protein BY458DRAFT_496538 [Sporodiniella umbellata]|nr:hypothetical protein BY458DRAFT_496538 [Sporodiniella umbellata]
MPSNTPMQSISSIITKTHSTFGEVPPPLVGASVNVVGDKIFVFGGRLASSRRMTNFLYILDLGTFEWVRHIPPPDSDPPPDARYFHSASIYENQLVIFGGMGHAVSDLCVMDDIAILDIETLCWRQIKTQPSLYSPQARYAHTSTVVGDQLIVLGGQDLDSNYLDEMNVLNLKTWEWVMIKALEKHVGAYRSSVVSVNQKGSIDQKDDLSRVYLYTNSNFAEVKRDLQIIQPNLVMKDCSESMTGNLPPGLRFPKTYVLGQHMILSGTYLVPGIQTYAIWALELPRLTWSRVDTGHVFHSGSWNRGILYKNQYLVLGSPYRNLLEDYGHRQSNFDYVAVVNLEAFGIYDLPETTCSSLAREMGLRLLGEPAVSDFNIITQDHQTIPVNSAVLRQRWPYFDQLIRDQKSTSLTFPYPQSVVSALLQFIYTDHLLTTQQCQPQVLSQLLIFSDMYRLPRLTQLATHALHQMLNMSNAPLIFETATLAHQTSLQLRALKLMIAAKKMIQQQQQPRSSTQSIASASSSIHETPRKQSIASIQLTPEPSESSEEKKTTKKKKGILRSIW